MNEPNVLTIDIETAPIVANVWGIWEQNVNLDMIETDWSILSYCAKWLHEKRVISAHTGGRGAAKVRDDKPLMGGLWQLLDSADIVVAQNGKAFDLKKINSRLLAHGFGPYSPVRVVDTLSVSRRTFGFTSNKLAWTSRLVSTKKSEHKKFPGFELWAECLKDNPAAWREMIKYNKIDVIATEQLYLKQRPWIDSHPNMGAYTHGEAHACPKCGSDKLKRQGYRLTQAGKYQQYQCKRCGGWSQGKTNLLAATKRKAMLK